MPWWMQRKRASGIASLVDLWSALGMQRAKDMVNTRGNLGKGIISRFVIFIYLNTVCILCLYIYIQMYNINRLVYAGVRIRGSGENVYF